MSLQIDRREREGVRILDLKGRLVMGPEATHFREIVVPLAAEEGGKLILNMAEIAYVDSTGLGALVLCSSTARKNASVLKLLAMNDRNLELLVTAKLETIFENFPDEQEAINSFFPDRLIKKFDILAFVREHQDEKAQARQTKPKTDSASDA